MKMVIGRVTNRSYTMSDAANGIEEASLERLVNIMREENTQLILSVGDDGIIGVTIYDDYVE